MDPLTLISAASTAYSLGKQLFGKQKSFGQTDYGRMLKRLSERGIETSPITGEISKELANTAQNAKVDLKGRLISQGMGGSIAGQRAISNIDTKRMDQLQKAIKDIQYKNEQLKSQYAMQYAQQGSQYDLAQQQAEEAATSDLLGTSASLLYEQLNPQKNYGQMLLEEQNSGVNNPYRPEVPIQPESNFVMPKQLPKNVNVNELLFLLNRGLIK